MSTYWLNYFDTFLDYHHWFLFLEFVFLLHNISQPIRIWKRRSHASNQVPASISIIDSPSPEICGGSMRGFFLRPVAAAVLKRSSATVSPILPEKRARCHALPHRRQSHRQMVGCSKMCMMNEMKTDGDSRCHSVLNGGFHWWWSLSESDSHVFHGGCWRILVMGEYFAILKASYDKDPNIVWEGT